MAIIIGGTAEFPGRNNHLIGSSTSDIIFGDPFTTGINPFFGVPQIGGSLVAGSGGNDRIEGRGGPVEDFEGDLIYGDAFEMAGTGQGGQDMLFGGRGGDLQFGDADRMHGQARGGDDTLTAGPGGLPDEGGSGVDILVGDARSMYGQARGGSDTLVAGNTFSQDDTGLDFRLYGDAGPYSEGMYENARGGHDTLVGGTMNDFLVGDGNQMSGNAVGGRDLLLGGDRSDLVYGDGDLGERARGGSDRLNGGRGNDQLHGDGASLSGQAAGGSDVLLGGDGGDRLYGDGRTLNGVGGQVVGGNDTLFGGAGSDRLYGDGRTLDNQVRCGNDVLDGGSGTDVLWGDGDPALTDLASVVSGADTFIFRAGGGQDRIGDFEPGKDQIVLQGFASLDLGDLLETGMERASRHDGSLVLDLGLAVGGPADVTTVTLAGVSQLSTTDFVLA